MTGGRFVSWIQKHWVGFYFATAGVWLVFSGIQIAAIVSGGPGTNGVSVFALVGGFLCTVLFAAAGVLTLIAKKRDDRVRSGD
ncbi:hypothetical protein E3O55_07275 [Cryobacterium sp. MDB1-18-2]|uniref:hypothetical protein n=1 Tax=unclassified Cryobacterium TaxID=2649013 RepID=UPI00106A47DC|nr:MULTISPECIES: hypothetical protein [unclassified Cryobacterium]TFC30778.1 hypothetical protein E3O55_07275 [Cryobacterium sp. MDB1-18-2]TFC38121.1 hypothetical protein E3O50_16995 [Cryobacterium sp. MDB1-18-1]